MNTPTASGKTARFHRPCLEAQCPNPATYRGRCSQHSRDREKQTHRNKSFYNTKRWKMTRRKQLFDHPLCVECQAQGIDTIATDVDHITPMEQGGDRWSPTNLQSLCAYHHGQKTRAEQ